MKQNTDPRQMTQNELIQNGIKLECSAAQYAALARDAYIDEDIDRESEMTVASVSCFLWAAAMWAFVDPRSVVVIESAFGADDRGSFEQPQ